MKKKKIVMLMLTLMAAFLVLGSHSFSEDKQSFTRGLKDIISKDVSAICKDQGKIKCHGKCVDGWSQEGYFDATKYKKDQLKVNVSLAESTINACFALQSSSECEPCYNKFELRKDGKLKEVSCEEFFQVIKEKNKGCDSCVDVIYGGCC